MRNVTVNKSNFTVEIDGNGSTLTTHLPISQSWCLSVQSPSYLTTVAKSAVELDLEEGQQISLVGFLEDGKMKWRLVWADKRVEESMWKDARQSHRFHGYVATRRHWSWSQGKVIFLRLSYLVSAQHNICFTVTIAPSAGKQGQVVFVRTLTTETLIKWRSQDSTAEVAQRVSWASVGCQHRLWNWTCKRNSGFSERISHHGQKSRLCPVSWCEDSAFPCTIC